MSNIDPEINYEDLSTVLGFVFEQMLKGIWTVAPGVIDSYNASTKRARVRPALRTLLTNGESESQPVIVNVPVVHPSGGGFVVHLPVRRGDAVLMAFSRRGLSRFKQTFAEVDPDDEGFFSIKDACVIPGFGSLGITPATANGVSMQTEDGSNHIYVENGSVVVTSTGDVTVNASSTEINAATNVVNGDMTVNGTVRANSYASTGTGAASVTGGLNVNGDEFTHNDVNVGEDHQHTDVVSGSDISGGPVYIMVRTLTVVNDDLSLDENGNLSVSTGLEGLRQKVIQKFRLFRGEWFLDTNAGLPYEQEILVRQVDVGLVSTMFNNTLLSEPEITNVTEFTSNLDPNTRLFTYTARVQTIFGEMEVTL